MIHGGSTADGIDADEAYDMITGETCTFKADFTYDSDTSQQVAHGAFLIPKGPTVCYQSSTCRYFDVFTGSWTVPASEDFPDPLDGPATRLVVDNVGQEGLVIVDNDNKLVLAAPEINFFDNIIPYFGSFPSTEFELGQLASAAGQGKTLILTGGAGTETTIEIYEYDKSSFGFNQKSYSQTLSISRFGHCSVIFTHPTYGSVVAVAGGIVDDKITVEYIPLDDYNLAPIVDTNADSSKPQVALYYHSCVPNPTDDGFYVMGGFNLETGGVR